MVDTSVTIFGNLTRNPDLSVKDDVARCNFRVASTERRWDRNAGHFVDGHSVFVSVTCWRQLAEHVAASVNRGDPVVVVGRLRQRSYVNADGVTVNLTEIDADVVAVDLRRGETTRLRKIQRQAGSDQTFDVNRPEDAGVRAEDAMSGLDGGETTVTDQDLAALAAGEPELVGAAAEPPF